MKPSPLTLIVLAAAGLTSLSARAGVAVTEVAPWSSGNSPVAADWFELTNTGSSSLDITGWRMDDNSDSFALSVPLAGVTTIAAGQSVVFIEGNGSNAGTFISTWFGSHAPQGLVIGSYSGSGVGLSTSGDAVNIFDASGTPQAGVSFGASPGGPVFATFDNAAGLSGTISQLSVAGVNGAFVAAGDPNEIGSPGTIAAVPEPATTALMLAGLGVVGAAARRRRQVPSR